MTDRETKLALSFGAAADAYEAGRPTYPAEAIDWLIEDRDRDRDHDRDRDRDRDDRDSVDRDSVDVVDVGAGTGKLTRALVGPGRRVTAVEPDPAMLATLRTALPDVVAHLGTAESMPLPDHSADLVVLGQAWHWVEPVAASAEIGRVLRRGGTLGLVWNIRDESLAWVAEMSAIMHYSAAERMILGADVTVAAPFGALEHRTFAWSRHVTRAVLEAMVASRSCVITATPHARADIDTRLSALFDSLPELADDGTIELPYVTHVFAATRTGG